MSNMVFNPLRIVADIWGHRQLLGPIGSVIETCRAPALDHFGDRIMPFLILGLKCYCREFVVLKKLSFDSGKTNPLVSLAFSSRFRRIV